ncbi:conserved hypothetical protein [Methanocella paludicola SANAE]|uniref:Nitrogen fixation protein NifH n=1 Tax=Methanocella paludicola (strain DSM 17711 / JCM 13418 / NBRC 101707 / SANAE) TaxID=304371 RepID=D1Z0B0_METPS|nr:prenyltransferase/squalene oxidase repeat-containing protein [Methanocella paludicola]BAI62132.1 conserved hypothetical protein [Methanocella paludicola SANAE]
MGDWTAALNGYPIDWLLEEDNPSVRYFTLTGLLQKPVNDPEVVSAKRSLMMNGLIPSILAKQEAAGYWGMPEDFYVRSKYKGTVWTLILLAHLGADGSDPRIKKACEYILDYSQDRESGGFSYRRFRGAAYRDGLLPCLTGNMAWCLIRFGYLDDPRVQRSIEWITQYQRFDDGDGSPSGWPYGKHEACWGRHTCHYGVVKALKALAEIPPRKRSKPVKATIEAGAEYLLKHRIYKSSHDPEKVTMPGWLKFSFPRMWSTDALEVLGILARLGYRDERMQDAIDAVLEKQDAQGRWLNEDRYGSRYIMRVDRTGRPSRWVTYEALHTLKLLKFP